MVVAREGLWPKLCRVLEAAEDYFFGVSLSDCDKLVVIDTVDCGGVPGLLHSAVSLV